jgi:dihydrofolate synthase/folylpolyglutamate synthase
MGMVNDKDISSVLSLLPKTAGYFFTNAHIPRALSHQVLKEKAAKFGLKGESYDDVNDAINAAKQKAGKDDLIIVCGSVFVVGEVDVP